MEYFHIKTHFLSFRENFVTKENKNHSFISEKLLSPFSVGLLVDSKRISMIKKKTIIYGKNSTSGAKSEF